MIKKENQIICENCNHWNKQEKICSKNYETFCDGKDFFSVEAMKLNGTIYNILLKLRRQYLKEQ